MQLNVLYGKSDRILLILKLKTFILKFRWLDKSQGIEEIRYNWAVK